MLIRQSARGEKDIREVQFIPHVSKNADGSCVIKMGKTQILCTAILEQESRGIIAEYGILPGSTVPRTNRGSSAWNMQEIQASITQVLNLVIDLTIFPNWGMRVDCDVLQAEGGLRSAAISGSYVAAALALKKVSSLEYFPKGMISKQIASLSCGIVKGELILDLDQEEAYQADVVSDYIFDGDGGTLGVYLKSQKKAISLEMMNQMAKYALQGCHFILEAQKNVLSK